MSDTIYKLQKRVETVQYRSIWFTRKVTDRINIEIPGVSGCQMQILEELGQPGSSVLHRTDMTAKAMQNYTT